MKLNSQAIPNHILKLMPKEARPKSVAGMTHDELKDHNTVKLEKNIHDDIISYLRRNYIPFDHSRMDRKSTNTVGQPDFAIYIHNRVLFLEVKCSNGKLSEEQIKRHAELEAYGNKIEVVYSYDEARIKILEFTNEKGIAPNPNEEGSQKT